MAREIHDTIAHGLTGIVTQLEAAGRPRDRPEEHSRHIDNAARLARESLVEARRSVEAAAAGGARVGEPAGRARVGRGRWSAINGIPVEVDDHGRAGRRSTRRSSRRCCGRRRRRSPTSPKHARATRVGVTLSFMGDVVALDVRDDGVGLRGVRGPGRARRRASG